MTLKVSKKQSAFLIVSLVPYVGGHFVYKSYVFLIIRDQNK